MIEPIVQRPPRGPLVPPGGSDLHQRDMTATFSGDLTLAQAQQHLAAIGQWLPIDGDPGLTLGQLVDANSTGPLRLGYGAWRDLLLGAQFRNGRGELISAGGRTVKNVAGYDLTKFRVGQHGVFGRLITITTRTYRLPAGAILATFKPELQLVNELMPSPLKPHWIVLTPDVILCGYLGDDRSLAFYRERLPKIGPIEVESRSVEQDIEHRQSLWLVAAPKLFRASVPPARVQEFIRDAKVDQWAADAAFGIVVGPQPDAGGETIARAAHAMDGAVKFVDRSTDPPRISFSRLSAQEREVLVRLKEAFDPEGKLHPIPQCGA
jgi:FAD/FMN-containing dehydrogenase